MWGAWNGTHGASQTKTTKLLEASDLRVFNKLYIIGNQQFINTINVLLCYYVRG